jgi:hypothetical protein
MIEHSILLSYLAYALCLGGVSDRNQSSLTSPLQKGGNLICDSLLFQNGKPDLFFNKVLKDLKKEMEVDPKKGCFSKVTQILHHS